MVFDMKKSLIFMEVHGFATIHPTGAVFEAHDANIFFLNQILK